MTISDGNPMRATKRTSATLAALTCCCLLGCADGKHGIAWPGAVEADIDDLTGARTGLFRTYGPTHALTAGRDTIPVTVGYWCRVADLLEPVAATDGLFFKIAMPDTTLLQEDAASFEALSGKLGLLDVARMAVDGNVYVWKYVPTHTIGAWYLDGEMGFEPPREELDTQAARDEQIDRMTEAYNALADNLRPATAYVARLVERQRETLGDLDGLLRDEWPPAHDYVVSHYRGRDTVGIELKGVLKFSMEGFDAAMDAVRFWCPVPQSHHEWNTARSAFMGTLDSLRRADADRVAEDAERRASERATAAREREQRLARLREQERLDSIAVNEDRESVAALTRAGVSRTAVSGFVKYARQIGIHPLATMEDVRRVCSRWEELGRPGRQSIGVIEWASVTLICGE